MKTNKNVMLSLNKTGTLKLALDLKLKERKTLEIVKGFLKKKVCYQMKEGGLLETLKRLRSLK